ncbi:COX15/CtaA family protein [Zhihengliuella flava]|uniref:Cytochrome c oxidase assembly protein subunit 15 n=1 Tax=Zhihengliuella flava TaxID=1285193 RepID=A0A931D798_9MICC|nr:COX15/CtaA family protein [Zhihengliuella flava]MBG6085754.1 cytochrome c oxidase assembly protein subunit 15 [Zhihengliuella flava]
MKGTENIMTQTSSWTRRLPTRVGRGVHALAIASLISQIGIIVTGGAVRLTESGLGCSEWPHCVPGSMTPTPEMGIHGVIEFGNRTLTFVLSAIAVAMIVAVWNMRRTHPVIFRLAIGLFCVIPAQALIGGITVWTDLNPWIVSLHFIVSATVVGFATLLVNRTAMYLRQDDTVAPPRVPLGSRPAAWIMLVSAAAAVVLGTVVTGTGPHAGDASSPRHPFDAEIVTRLHTAPVYVLLAATVVLTVLIFARAQPDAATRRLRTGLVLLLAVLLAQAGLGYWQHFTGLPIGLVLLHMLGSALLVSTAVNVWDRSTGRFPL